MAMTWICCPVCGAVEAVRRLGNVGVAEARYGWRVKYEDGVAKLRGRHSRDSKSFKCDACGSVFKNGGVCLWESFGREPREEVPY